MNFLNELIKKWGNGEKLESSWTQKKLLFISEYAKLNVLFDPIKEKKKYLIILNETNSRRLLNFYSNFNGCRLFSNSLCIYGIQVSTHDAIETYDLYIENDRINHTSNLPKGYIYFGSLGGKYLFGLKKHSLFETVYCFDIDNSKLIKKFTNFDLLFNILFTNLYEEYDLNGEKIHKNDEFKSINSLYNTTIDSKFLEEQ